MVLLGGLMVVYVLATLALGVWASRRVDTAEDFLVAGRRLGLPLVTATLLATWFGAGTMVTAADEVRADGLKAIALEPLGAGLCLLIAGLWLARPLWKMKLLTLADFFRQKFGARAELVSAVVMVPSYFGWIAVQFLALAGMLDVLFGIDPAIGIVVVATIGATYTLLGGMWAVAITDAVQLVLLLLGLVVVAIVAVLQLEPGVLSSLPPGFIEPVPLGSSRELVGWLAILAISALGNLPGQDLMQRIFAARTANIARTACLLAGVGYLVFGAIPVFLGVIASVLAPEAESAVVVALARSFLSPPVAAIFFGALVSAVLSTIDSAILSPSSVIAQNILRYRFPRVDLLVLNRISVAFVTGVSVAVAFIGESAYGILEAAYEVGLVGLFIPLAMGMIRQPRRESPALAVMAIGFTSWLTHLIGGWESFLNVIDVPPALPTLVIEVAVYLVLDRCDDERNRVA